MKVPLMKPIPTLTIRQLKAALEKVPEQCLDLPVRTPNNNPLIAVDLSPDQLIIFVGVFQEKA